MTTGNGQQQDPSHIAVAAGLGEQTPLLHAILSTLRGETMEIAVSDAAGREMLLEKFPVTGRKRVLAYRTGNGYDGLTIPTTGVLVVPANEGRLGSQWVNAGANPIILYLSDQKRGGVPAVWLNANGGAWDGRFANLAWAGNIFAVAQTAASTLVGGEL